MLLNGHLANRPSPLNCPRGLWMTPKKHVTRGRPRVDPDRVGVSCRGLVGSRLSLRGYRQCVQMSAVDTLGIDIDENSHVFILVNNANFKISNNCELLWKSQNFCIKNHFLHKKISHTKINEKTYLSSWIYRRIFNDVVAQFWDPRSGGWIYDLKITASEVCEWCPRFVKWVDFWEKAV